MSNRMYILNKFTPQYWETMKRELPLGVVEDVMDQFGNYILVEKQINNDSTEYVSRVIRLSGVEQAIALSGGKTMFDYSPQVGDLVVHSNGVEYSWNDYKRGASILPPIEKYRTFLAMASKKFNISMDECRDRFGKYTLLQWEQLLGVQNLNQ